METDTLRKEIDALITELGDEVSVAKPAVERAVLQKIRTILDLAHSQRTGTARDIWQTYLPYAAQLCLRLSRLEEGWEDELEFFAAENAQYWLDLSNACLEQGKISETKEALSQILDATRMVKRDMILRVDILLQSLEIAVEITDSKRAVQLYEEAEKVYRKHLAGSDQYTGSGWLRKIKKMGQQLAQYQEKLRRYFRYSDSVTVSIEAASERDLTRLIEYLQQNLSGKVKVTRKVKEMDGQDTSRGYRARVKINLD